MELINKIKAFINKEADARISKQKELLALPLNKRVLRGDALPYLEEIDVERINPRINQYHSKVLAWADNDSKFKVGDYILIHKGDLDDAENVYEAWIEKEFGNSFLITRGFNEQTFKEEIGEKWIMERDNPDLRRFFIGAMNSLPFAEHKDMILSIVKGEAKPNYEISEVKAAMKIANDYSFNPPQRKAFIRAYSTTNYAIIQGPPGTGKTWLLAHIALALAKKGQKVLITSLTHRAINNALLKIRSISTYPNIIKVGQYYYEDDLKEYHIKCYDNFEEYYTDDWKENGLIIGGSSYAVHTSRLKNVNFDTIIYDEASQLTISHTVASMMKGAKYIFIGDHKQMPPIYNAKHKDVILKQSVFESIIYKEKHASMLNITYRMNESLNRLPSEAFYNSELISFHPHRKYSFELNKELPELFRYILDPEQASIVVKLKHEANKMQSAEEASLISNIVTELILSGVASLDIGVIVPYRAQARKIRSCLASLPEQIKNKTEDIIVDTVERMQGQEREVVIISMASSDKDFIKENTEFLFNPNRFNVAITRAKSKRIFICSNNLLEAISTEFQKEIDNFKRLFESSCGIEIAFSKN